MAGLNAILRIAAQVSGAAAIGQLSSQLAGVGPAANSSTPPVKRLGSAIGDMAKIAAGIQLSRFINGLEGFTKNAFKTGDEALVLEQRIQALGEQFNESAQIMSLATNYAEKYTYSQITAQDVTANTVAKMRLMGVEMKQIEEMLMTIGQASRSLGLSKEDSVEFFRQLSQAMATGRINGENLVTILERIPQFGPALIKAYNQIAKDKGIIQITKQRGEEIIKATQKAEKEQIKILKNSAREKEDLIQKETNAKLEGIRERYDREITLLRDKNEREIRLLQDRFDDEDRIRARAERDARNRLFERMDDEQRAVLTAFNRRRQDLEEWRDYYNDLNGINEYVQKEIRRRDDDWWDAQERNLMRGFDRQRQAQEDRIEDEKVIRDRLLRDQRQAQEKGINDTLAGQENALAKRQAVEEEAVKVTSEARLRGVQDALDEEVEMVKEANAKIIKDTKARMEATMGDLKNLGAQGLLTNEVGLQAVKELRKILPEMPEPTALQKWDKVSSDFASTVGKDLNPALSKLVDLVGWLEDRFQGLDKTIRTTLTVAGGIAGIALAIKAATGTFDALRGGRAARAPAAPPPPSAPMPPTNILQRLGPKAYSGPVTLPSPPPAPAPGPWLRFIGVLGNATSAVGGFLGNLAKIPGAIGGIGSAIANTRIAATVLGWAAVLGPKGPIAGAISGTIAWLTGTAGPAIAGFFSGPAGWTVLAGVAIAAAAYTWREPISQFMVWLEGKANDMTTTIGGAWDNAVKGIEDAIGKQSGRLGITKAFDDLFSGIARKADEISAGIGKSYDNFVRGIERIAERIGRAAGNGFSTAGTWIKNGLNYVIGLCESSINEFSKHVNRLIESTNSISGRIGINIPFRLQPVDIPRLARGGWTDQPTLAMIGEGGDPGGEYAIPAARMPQAIDAWQGGARGNALIAAMQSPGLAPGRGGTGPAYSAPSGGSSSAPPVINLSIRPQAMLQTPDNRQWLSADDLPQIIAAAVAAGRGR